MFPMLRIMLDIPGSSWDGDSSEIVGKSGVILDEIGRNRLRMPESSPAGFGETVNTSGGDSWGDGVWN
jgi:hypothetical protein